MFDKRRAVFVEGRFPKTRVGELAYKRSGFWLLLAVVIGAASSPGGLHALTLEEALQGLVERHPQIRAARGSIESAESGVGIAGSRFLPTLGLTGDAGYERVDTPTRRSAGQEPFDGARRKLTLSVTQNLFDGFGKQSNLRQAEISKDAAESNYRGVRQSVLLEAVNAYLSVMRESRLVELAIQNERNIQQQQNLEDERVQRGSGIAVDVLQAKARLQLAKERRIAFEGARIDALSRFRQVFDMDADPAKLVDPVIPQTIVPQSLDAAVAAAVADNPALERATRLVTLADERKRGAAAGYWPRLDLVGRANQEHDVDGVSGTRRDLAVLLQVTWDLFSGFATDYAVSQASAEAAVSRDTESNARRKTVEEVRLAWQSLDTARQRETLLINAVEIATEVFESRKRLRDSGRETALNVLDSEAELYAARINLVAASFDARFAVYRVLAAIGAMEAQALKAR